MFFSASVGARSGGYRLPGEPCKKRTHEALLAFQRFFAHLERRGVRVVGAPSPGSDCGGSMHSITPPFHVIGIAGRLHRTWLAWVSTPVNPT